MPSQAAISQYLPERSTQRSHNGSHTPQDVVSRYLRFHFVRACRQSYFVVGGADLSTYSGSTSTALIDLSTLLAALMDAD
ncbi:hypothetical protein PM082_007062 [Marasmius tenuissimus]|nr:hypothetical protein PM082_007062 [Marasmius tenuissimus]